ncbi:DNA-binding Xre family transcriptional regulator [Paenibacillus phyllosphaerae]|uniref:DNA-binding Xre family transcriptional regulator n=1 Tax=Paenibacillus phyllosphaerae TaxID=274593 RepID=A0A7W5B088_9BACL|nr:DNA-binding Xre family transcriptional regulator [Paenibacillus phyllosphaerae]
MPVFEAIFKEINVPMAILKRNYKGLYFDRSNEAFVQLAGYTEGELSRLNPNMILYEWKDSSLPEVKTLYTLRTKQNQRLNVKISCKKSDSDSEPAWIFTANDASAELWIEEQMRNQTILISGIVDSNHVFERFDKKYPHSLFDDDTSLIASSIMSIIHEDEQARIREALRRAVLSRQAEKLNLRTKWIGNKLDLEVSLTFAPFYNFDNSLKQYAFIVTDLRSKQDDPAVKLQIMMARRKISAQELSESTGISVQTISKLRNGKILKPQRLTAELLATVLGVKPQDIWA